jgi:hypothetical protein
MSLDNPRQYRSAGSARRLLEQRFNVRPRRPPRQRRFRDPPQKLWFPPGQNSLTSCILTILPLGGPGGRAPAGIAIFRCNVAPSDRADLSSPWSKGSCPDPWSHEARRFAWAERQNARHIDPSCASAPSRTRQPFRNHSLAASQSKNLSAGDRRCTQRSRWPQPRMLRIAGRHRSVLVAGCASLRRDRASRAKASKTQRRSAADGADARGWILGAAAAQPNSAFGSPRGLRPICVHQRHPLLICVESCLLWRRLLRPPREFRKSPLYARICQVSSAEHYVL